MFFPTRPSPAAIARFLDASSRLPLSYAPVGVLNTIDATRLDVASVPLGHGVEVYDRARRALDAWRQFDMDWVQVWPPMASTDVGTVVAVQVRHLGFWSLNGCRVVYHCGGQHDARHGYAYGTLPNHAEAGEETFEVAFDPATGAVAYHLRATSWPYALLATLGQPFVRRLQARFRRDSGRAMQRAVQMG